MLEIILNTCQVYLSDPKNDPKNDPKKRAETILKLIQQNRDITVSQLAKEIKVSEKTIKRDITKLKDQNRLQRVGKKGGYWVVLEKD